MKTWMVLFGMLLASSFSLVAQEEFRRNENQELRKEKMLEKLTTELELTSEQRVKVSQMLDEAQQKRKELREKIREEKKQLKEEHMMLMNEVLTEDQFAKYEMMAEKREEQMRNSRIMEREN